MPLQHLTGRAYFRHLEVEVGPGVFVPRPETEVMTGWAIDRLRPMVAEPADARWWSSSCTGSGAIAKAIATELTGHRVHAVELSPEAAAYAAATWPTTPVELHVADMADALPELDGTVDLVIANPPYIPLDAYASVAPEARDHDPMVALFSGPDGLDAIRVVIRVAARLLRRPVCSASSTPTCRASRRRRWSWPHGAFTGVRDHRDLTGRPRFVTAVRRGR